MTRLLAATAVIAALLCGVAVRAAAPAKPPVKAQQSLPLPCDTKDSPSYVPGVDANGRPVTPADAPTDTHVVISTEIYPELKSTNPQLRGTGLAVRIDGLGQPPRCPPLSNKPRN